MNEVVVAWLGLNFSITGIGVVTVALTKFLKGGLG